MFLCGYSAFYLSQWCHLMWLKLVNCCTFSKHQITNLGREAKDLCWQSLIFSPVLCARQDLLLVSADVINKSMGIRESESCPLSPLTSCICGAHYLSLAARISKRAFFRWAPDRRRKMLVLVCMCPAGMALPPFYSGLISLFPSVKLVIFIASLSLPMRFRWQKNSQAVVLFLARRLGWLKQCD